MSLLGKEGKSLEVAVVLCYNTCKESIWEDALKLFKNRKTRNDLILLAVLLILCGAVLLLRDILSGEGEYVTVSVDGEVVARYSLRRDCEEVIQTPYGENVIVISDGYCYVKESDCKNRICVNTGKIGKSGETVTCLPHRLTLTVSGTGETDFIQ